MIKLHVKIAFYPKKGKGEIQSLNGRSDASIGSVFYCGADCGVILPVQFLFDTAMMLSEVVKVSFFAPDSKKIIECKKALDRT